ncbi:uncharacterized protein CLUP02_01206 [Colletotrichum lupini]|uniref:Uncharacterized protein n=1 Tax=Colletotrichum lupini TaxID=145971 RepID=A0A9Q8W9Q0_9PEZI|nr:uncharacterized protein CLUP02_01206 [Colletotrichum lupini]UQC74555.1 hypothetical protein CLUP02_01206 [Colletotrichum lupini]
MSTISSVVNPYSFIKMPFAEIFSCSIHRDSSQPYGLRDLLRRDMRRHSGQTTASEKQYIMNLQAAKKSLLIEAGAIDSPLSAIPQHPETSAFFRRMLSHSPLNECHPTLQASATHSPFMAGTISHIIEASAIQLPLEYRPNLRRVPSVNPRGECRPIVEANLFLFNQPHLSQLLD